VGVNEGVADAGLGGKMNHHVEQRRLPIPGKSRRAVRTRAVIRGSVREEAFHGSAMGNVQFVEGEIGIFFYNRQTCLFQGDIVIITEIVDADNVVAVLKKSF